MNRFVLSLAAVASVAVSLLAFTAGGLVLGSVTPAAAQPAPGPGGNARFGKMLLSLQPPLTEDQKKRIRAIMADARAKARSLTDVQAKRDTMRAAFTKIRTVLTPAQQAKMKAEFDASRAHQNSAGHS